MEKISVIMPLYNAAKYLPETLESVLQQTYHNFELICINDASTDNTLDILQKFASQDSRIHILTNEERIGAGESRNQGMKKIKGNYLTFLDGDDIYDKNMLKLAYESIRKHDADIVVYESINCTDENIHEKKKVYRGKPYIDKYCRKSFSIQDFSYAELLFWGTGPTNKLYRSDFIRSNHIEFQSLSDGNDVYFTIMVLLSAKKIIKMADRRVFVYVRNHNSPTRISANKDPMNLYRAFEKIKQELIARNMFEKTASYFYYFVVWLLRTMIVMNKQTEEKMYNFLQTEGIKRLISMDKQIYMNIDPYIRKELERYQTEPFSTAWYKTQEPIVLYLNCNKEKVIALFAKYKKEDKKIAIWGVGTNGKSLLRFLRENTISISEVIDNDRNKQGQFIEGYYVTSPKNMSEDISIVWITSDKIYETDLNIFRNKEFEFVDENVIDKLEEV